MNFTLYFARVTIIINTSRKKLTFVMEEEEDDDDVFSSFSHDGIDYNQSKALEVFDSRYNTKLDYNIILYFKTFDYIIIKKMEMI